MHLLFEYHNKTTTTNIQNDDCTTPPPPPTTKTTKTNNTYNKIQILIPSIELIDLSTTTNKRTQYTTTKNVSIKKQDAY